MLLLLLIRGGDRGGVLLHRRHGGPHHREHRRPVGRRRAANPRGRGKETRPGHRRCGGGARDSRACVGGRGGSFGGGRCLRLRRDGSRRVGGGGGGERGGRRRRRARRRVSRLRHRESARELHLEMRGKRGERRRRRFVRRGSVLGSRNGASAEERVVPSPRRRERLRGGVGLRGGARVPRGVRSSPRGGGGLRLRVHGHLRRRRAHRVVVHARPTSGVHRLRRLHGEERVRHHAPQHRPEIRGSVRRDAVRDALAAGTGAHAARRSRKLRRRSEPTEPGDGGPRGDSRVVPVRFGDGPVAASVAALALHPRSRARESAELPSRSRTDAGENATRQGGGGAVLVLRGGGGGGTVLVLTSTRAHRYVAEHPAGGPVSLAPAAEVARLLDVVVVVVAKLRLLRVAARARRDALGPRELGPRARRGLRGGIRARLFRALPLRVVFHISAASSLVRLNRLPRRLPGACRFRRRGARRHPSCSPSPSPRFRRRYRRSRPPPGSRPRSRRSCGIRPLLPLQWRPAKSGRKIRRGGEREGQGSRVWNRARSVESDIREGAGKDEMRGPLSLRSRQRTRRTEGP